MLSTVFLSGMVEINDAIRSRKGARLVSELGNDFEQDENGFVYYKGVAQPLPKVMVDSLLDAKLNPNTQLYSYLFNEFFGNMFFLILINIFAKVFLNGYSRVSFLLQRMVILLPYRNVDIKDKSFANKELYNFVQESWSKIKRWKKSPAKFKVAKLNKEYLLVKDDYYNEDATILGQVDTLKTDFDTAIYKVTYMPQHKGPYGQHIEFGIPVTMPREECDNDPSSSCSRGLHCKSAEYDLHLGSEIIVTLVNPYNVVAIPEYDFTKFRCCEYLPISKAELKDSKLVEFEPGTYDIPYNGIESLEKMLQTFSVIELQEKGLLSTELEEGTFNVIFKKAKEVINNRVIKN